MDLHRRPHQVVRAVNQEARVLHRHRHHRAAIGMDGQVNRVGDIRLRLRQVGNLARAGPIVQVGNLARVDPIVHHQAVAMEDTVAGARGASHHHLRHPRVSVMYIGLCLLQYYIILPYITTLFIPY